MTNFLMSRLAVTGTVLASLMAAPGLAQDAETNETPSEEIAAPVDVSASTVVATVNGEEITIGHVISARQGLPEQYQSLPAEVLFTGLIDQLIQQTVLGQTMDELSTRAEIQLENERRALIATEVIDDVASKAVTEEKIQAAYDAEFVDAEPTEEWSAAHILLETEEKAAEITELAKAEGADFAALAKEHSTGPSGPNGGDLGWFSTGMMVAPFETAIADMSKGEVVGPIETQFGWHVIKLNDVRTKGAPPLEVVREELVTRIQTDAVQEALETLTAAADVERRDVTGINPEILNDLSLLD
ncbi:MAG: peptidylprolyl isomerase [Maritimibacter sp.]